MELLDAEAAPGIVGGSSFCPRRTRNVCPAARALRTLPEPITSTMPSAGAVEDSIPPRPAAPAPTTLASNATSPRTGADIEQPCSCALMSANILWRCRKRNAEGPADHVDRRGPEVMLRMRLSDRCGTHCLGEWLAEPAESRSRISVSSWTSVISLASSAAFSLARRSLSLFIGRTMAK